ncbi:MAG: hypothetical protein QOG13_3285 [Sphingomonadales bacterium]|nr:hypothetical protein [Sphingomonadales bacterium]
MNEESAAPLDAQEDESDFLLPGLNANFDAAVAASDWTAETIVSQLRKGNIDLDPSFQRREAWQRTRKSQFIESLILGIPTPQIILAERKERRGSYLVIDGKQRLLTLRQFTAGPDDPLFKKFKLGGLLARPDLNRLNYEQLAAHPTSPLSALENANIRTVVIKSWSSEEFLYEVFLRINSGSVQLSPQELRQALHPGKFTDALNDYTIESEGIRAVLNLSQPDFRMRDNELVLRYMAFRKAVERYNGNLKQFLDDVTLFYNSTWDTSEEEAKRVFSELDASIAVSSEIFGSAVFKKWNGVSFESRINRAIFDVVSYFFSFPDIAAAAVQRAPAVVAQLKSLCETDADFVVAVTSTTKSVEAVQTRYRRWRDALQQTLDREIPFPRVA